MEKNSPDENREKTFLSFNSLSIFSSRPIIIGISIFTISMMLISLFAITLTVPTSQASQEINSNLNQEEVDFELVRGYFNDINYTGSSEGTSIELTHPDGITYQWTYSDRNWSGDLDYLYKGDTRYQEQTSSWFVSIALDHDVPTDNNWSIKLDNNQYKVSVVKPDEKFSVSGSVEFQFEPNMGKVYGVSDSITLGNPGNVPMSYELKYDDENLEHNSNKKILEPGESANPVLYYNYSTSAPEIFTVELSIQRKVVGILDLESEESHRVKGRGAITRNFEVFVGYEGYEQGKGIGYSVQYQKSEEVEGNTYNRLTFYVYPKEDVSLRFNQENLSFGDENVTITPKDTDGNELEEIDFEPGKQLSSEYGEVEITVEFKSDREDDGFVELVVERDRYTTDIQISQAAPKPGNEEVSVVEEQAETITLGAILIGGVIVFGAARVLLSNKEED